MNARERKRIREKRGEGAKLGILQTAALVVVIAAGVRLVGVALLMALRPRYCPHLFEKTSAAALGAGLIHAAL